MAVCHRLIIQGSTRAFAELKKSAKVYQPVSALLLSLKMIVSQVMFHILVSQVNVKTQSKKRREIKLVVCYK